jgi:ABC-type nitrate/sulfonate/bicarbonate transport system substrate-binding protein
VIRQFVGYVFASTLVLNLWSSAIAQAPATVKFALLENNFTINVPVYVMKDQKLDIANGIDLQIHTFANIEGVYQSMRAGDSELAPGGWTNVVQWRATGSPWTVVYPIARGAVEVLVPKDSPIKTLADLKGKNVGTYAGPTGTATMLLRTLLADYYGFDPAKSNNLQYGGSPILINALKKGEIAALVMLDPLATRLIASGEARSVVNLADDYEAKSGRKILWIAWLAQEKLIKRSPETINKLLTAYKQALDYLNANPEAWKKYANISGVDDAAFPMLVKRTVDDLKVEWSQQRIDDLEAFAGRVSAVLGTDVMPNKIPPGTMSLEFAPER